MASSSRDEAVPRTPDSLHPIDLDRTPLLQRDHDQLSFSFPDPEQALLSPLSDHSESTSPWVWPEAKKHEASIQSQVLIGSADLAGPSSSEVTIVPDSISKQRDISDSLAWGIESKLDVVETREPVLLSDMKAETGVFFHSIFM